MNENQENNLNSVTPEVSNTEPVEPVVTPTPAPVAEPTQVESPAPVVEPTQVESQAPVAEPTPTPVETPSPVAAPTPVETTAPVAEPLPVQPVQPVVEPVPNVAPVVNSAPVSEPVIAAKKSNPVVVVLLILVLIGVCGYGLYKYTDIFKPKTKNSGTTVTTTTTSSVVSNLAFKTFDEFIAVVSKNNHNDEIIDLSNNFTYLKFDLRNKCVNNGDEVSFKIADYNISYVCNGGLNEEKGEYEWSANVAVNNTYKKEVVDVMTTDTSYPVYTNGKYYLEFTSVGSVYDHNELDIKDINGNSVLNKIKYKNYYTLSKDNDSIIFDVVNKDNIIYFMTTDSTEEGLTNCNIKYIDLNADKLEIKDTSLTGSCYNFDF